MADSTSLLEKWLSASEFLVIGRKVSRVDSLEKALGKALFTEDYYIDYFLGNALYVKQVLSTYPHARLKSISLPEHLRSKGVKLFTARDIPGENQVGYALPDQPLLAEGKVRYHGEVVALVASIDMDEALRAVEEVRVEYEPLPYILDPLEAMNRNDILIHEEAGSNIAFKTRVRRGNVEEGFSRAHVIVENEYRLHHQEHAYLETEAALAIPSIEGGVTIIGGLQYPHLGQRIVARVLGLPLSKVKIVAPYIGGGFGGKDDEGPLACAKAALVAYLTGKPALLIYSREESIKVHPKREAAIIRYRSGADADGRLTAIDVTIIHDTGAYANRGPFILWRATMHASGPYVVPNARIDGYAVYTNKVYQGSFRGFGNLSIQFAVERQMDQLAERLGLDPVEFRLKNIVREGSFTITGQLLDHSVGVADALVKVANTCRWRERRREIEEFNKHSERIKKGIGVAVAWHGISTSRGVPDWSNAYVKIEQDGSVTLYTGIVEIGQGSPSSAHVQIVCELLGITPDRVRVVYGTTDSPDTGATHASRGSSIGGIGVYVAASKLRERLSELASRVLGVSVEDLVFADNKVYSKSNPGKQISLRDLVKEAMARGVELSATGYFFLPKGRFDDAVGQGFAYPAYSYIVVVSEVEVDTLTGVVRVTRVYPGLAAGRIINPQQVEGQIEGAVAQGVGYALMEKLVFSDNGEVLNTNLTDYVIPTIKDVPEIAEPIYVEDLFKYGPFGAKGVGEMALIPMPASIANAVSHALGVNVTRTPLTPEEVLRLIGRL
ncbi:xanthine dehydrogenase family protein molybdopterin-binding subunit [Desulfurococcus amylolyticus]|uniref:xanthine dehydrogenase family protein molybdopterin-binding subunit n=1 Tax=Desulfurococcus amylolyticus TaxID=94694 RepID=UPI0005B2123D|nr:xanthine dehydrogenase family protein molybdopterin-binding subunit [Desulfurococcus amylolyticus]